MGLNETNKAKNIELPRGDLTNKQLKELLTQSAHALTPTASPKQQKTAEAEQREQQQKHEEQEAQNSFFNSIKTAIPNAKYNNILKYIELIHRDNKIFGCILLGETGTGKSITIKSALKEQKIDFAYFNTYTTPLSFYKEAYYNRNKTLVIDDCEGLYKDIKGVAILKALLNTDDTRLIRYESTSEKLDVPSQFIFTGKIIILANDSTNTLNDALLSRCIVREISFTNEEKLNFVMPLLQFHHSVLTEQQQTEIKKFFVANVSTAVLNFNFRTINKVAEFYKNYPNDWVILAMEELQIDEELQIIYENRLMPKSDQHRRWIEGTGKSIRTFQRRKKEMLKR